MICPILSPRRRDLYSKYIEAGNKRARMEKILCVDDDFSLLHLYRQELSEAGYKVILARDGKEALLKFKEEKPQVVVLDIRMPGIDGIEILNTLLSIDRQAQVILMTGYPQYKENFMTWGAVSYLVKSPNLDELKQKICEVLKKQGRPPSVHRKRF